MADNSKSGPGVEGGYRWGNSPPASNPTPNPYQQPQRLGWCEGSGADVKSPRGGDWTQIGDHSEVGRRLFTDKPFTSGMQNGRKR
jgi:hypothetical protein